MNFLVSSLILLLGSLVIGAQQPAKLVFWGGDPTCGIKTRSIPVEDKISCTSTPTERGPVSTIHHNGISLSVAFLEDADYHLVGAGIANNTTEPIFFDADSWGAAHFKDKTDFHERLKPIRAETSIPSRDILRILAKGIRHESSLDTFIAEGQKTNETREIRRSDGTRQRVDVIVPDKETQQSVARQNATRSEMVLNEQRRIRQNALTAKSVAPNHVVKGLVYFTREKNADFVVFSMGINGTTYVFQLPRLRK